MQKQPLPSRPDEQNRAHLLLPEMIQSEVNFLIFPFFALSRKGLDSTSEIEYREIIERQDGKEERVWTVSAHPRFGYPGPFDREVHKTVECILNEHTLPIRNPVCMGSLYGLCRRMGIADSGWNKKRIKKALRKIVATVISSENAFYHKGRRQRITEGTFHLYDGVYFRGEHLPDGSEADATYLLLSALYLESLNSFYVARIDYAYLKALESKVASRLYELLEVSFYSARCRRQPCVWFDYRILCQLLPITPQKYFSAAQQKLRPAHDELVKTAFLSSVRWHKGPEGAWLIYYYPGERVKEEAKSIGIQEELRLEAPQEIPSDTSGNIADEENLVSELQKRGISKKQAQRLVKDHSNWINRAIELWELERQRNPNRMKSPPGYLVSIIEAGEDWQAPDDYVSAEEKKDRQEKKRRDELIEELVSLTDDNTPPSELLTKSDKPPTIKELEKEVARIKGEKANRQAKREQDRKARIDQVLEGLSDKEREAIRTEALSSVDKFLRSSETFQELSQQDIREWQGSGPVASPLVARRDEVIWERYLKED